MEINVPSKDLNPARKIICKDVTRHRVTRFYYATERVWHDIVLHIRQCVKEVIEATMLGCSSVAVLNWSSTMSLCYLVPYFQRPVFYGLLLL